MLVFNYESILDLLDSGSCYEVKGWATEWMPEFKEQGRELAVFPLVEKMVLADDGKTMYTM